MLCMDSLLAFIGLLANLCAILRFWETHGSKFAEALFRRIRKRPEEERPERAVGESPMSGGDGEVDAEEVDAEEAKAELPRNEKSRQPLARLTTNRALPARRCNAGRASSDMQYIRRCNTG